ncbi:MAG: asparagine synthase (glutamine-hydrolyzing) [Planctomycetaceae bacterium]|nr:asparagine synthase (glutamine-hydrolyzing) [Planctomycetaceae bacterium]
MCGIAGIQRFDGQPVRREVLDAMVATLDHRGPDANGVELRGSVGLGHTRLSIIDLSGGVQPMVLEDDELVVTFNGEIFNYIELRQELIAHGRRFTTTSDTEVLLQAYAQWGEDCVKHFNGQWAFAVWDARRKKLFLSRDRLGKRPLFYTVSGNAFLFASEVKAIFAHPGVSKAIDPVGLDQLCTFWSAQPPRTIFEGINLLPPGHSLTVQDGKLTVAQYWDVDFSEMLDNVPARELEEQLLELLTDATRLRLRSDVPVGAYLSGGLDSSITAALAKDLNRERLCTFSVEFENPEFDESIFQQEVVQRLGTEHHTIRCSHDDIGRIFPQVIRHTETPILRTAPAPMFMLSKLVRESGIKVVLTGEGADEAFGGYDIFKEAKLRRFWSRQPESRVRPMLLKRLYPYMKNIQSQPPAYLRAFFGVKPQTVGHPFFSHLPRFELTSKLKAFFTPEVLAATFDHDPLIEAEARLPAAFHSWDGFSQSQYLEARGLMPGYILSSQGDRMTMANSIEGRFPFLDHRVVEFAAKLPPRLKMAGLDEKHILKNATKHLVPDSIRQRSKQPYRAPDAQSFFDTDSGMARFEYVDAMLSPSAIANAGLFDPEAVSKLVEKARTGAAIGTKDNMALVGILSAQLVVEQFVNGRPVDVPEAEVSCFSSHG